MSVCTVDSPLRDSPVSINVFGPAIKSKLLHYLHSRDVINDSILL